MYLEFLRRNNVVDTKVCKSSLTLFDGEDGYLLIYEEFLNKLVEYLKAYDVNDEYVKVLKGTKKVKKNETMYRDIVFTYKNLTFFCHGERVTRLGHRYLRCCLVDNDIYNYVGNFHSIIHSNKKGGTKKKFLIHIPQSIRGGLEKQYLNLALIKPFASYNMNIIDMLKCDKEPHHLKAKFDNRSCSIVPMSSKQHHMVHSNKSGGTGKSHQLDVVIKNIYDLEGFIRFINSDKYNNLFNF